MLISIWFVLFAFQSSKRTENNTHTHKLHWLLPNFLISKWSFRINTWNWVEINNERQQQKWLDFVASFIFLEIFIPNNSIRVSIELYLLHTAYSNCMERVMWTKMVLRIENLNLNRMKRTFYWMSVCVCVCVCCVRARKCIIALIIHGYRFCSFVSGHPNFTCHNVNCIKFSISRYFCIRPVDLIIFRVFFFLSLLCFECTSTTTPSKWQP